MSIIAPIGYQDDQIQSQWQSQPFVNEGRLVNPGAAVVEPLQNVANWQSLQFAVQNTTGDLWVKAEWFGLAAAGGSLPLGFREIVVGNANFGSFVWPNLGPFVKITFTNLAGVQTTLAAVVTGCNRTVPRFTPIGDDPLINIQNLFLNAGASATIEAAYPYSGLAHASIIRAVSSFKYELQGIDETGLVQALRIWDTSTGTPANNQSELLIVPPLHLQCVVTNNGAGAGNFWFMLTADLSN